MVLTDDRMATIRINPFICTSEGNYRYFITVSSTAFTDVAVTAAIPERTGIFVENFVLDDIPPMLIISSLNVEMGTLVLTFSEPVSSEKATVSIPRVELHKSVYNSWCRYACQL